MNDWLYWTVFLVACVAWIVFVSTLVFDVADDRPERELVDELYWPEVERR